MRYRILVVAIGSILLIALAQPVAAGSPATQVPAPFGKYLVYTAAGVYDASLPPVDGDLAVWFHHEIMGRDDAEIVAERARADAYFTATFGSRYTPGSLAAFGVDPRKEYRVYFISGESVPPEVGSSVTVASWPIYPTVALSSSAITTSR